MLPLRRLLLRDLLILVSATAALVGLSLVWNLHRSLREQAEARASVLVDRLRADLNADMGRVESLGETLQALWEAGPPSGARRPEADEAQLFALVSRHPMVATAFLVNADGDGVFLFQSDLTRPAAQRTLNGFAITRPGALVQLRAEGRPLAQAARPKGLSYHSPVTRPWFQAAREASGPRWVDPYAFFGTNLPGITYIVPLRDPVGAFKGAIALDLMLEDLTERFWDSRPTPGSLFGLVDGQGRLVLMPKAQGLLDREARAQAFMTPLSGTFLPALDQVWRARPEASWFKAEGQSHFGLRRALRPGQGPAWTLLLSIPEAELIGSAQRRLVLTAGLTLLCLLLVGLRARHLARRFGDPLRDLARAAESLVQGRVPEPPATAISELRTVGEALQRAGRMVVDRTRLQQQLQHSQRLETVGTLAGGIAHDVNNQLGAIMGQLFLAREAMPPGHPAAQRVARAEEAVERCAQTTKALLAFSHHGETKLQPLDLNALVRRTATLLDRVLGGLIRVELDLDPGLPGILGEPLQLEQVLMNMAVNARDAMPEGGHLWFRTRRSDTGEVTLEVQDTGRGIPPAILPQIFEPFFTTKPVGKGTGLGLAMAFGILHAHGGRIDVESEVGRGTAFTLVLPASGEAPLDPSGPHRAEPEHEGPLAGLRILVVEDEADLRETLADALTVARAQVETADDGEKAWLLFRASRYDLILSDHRMPVCTGMELLRRVRGTGSRIPFILSSGQDLEPFQSELQADPRLRLLPKPFSVARLLEMVMELRT